MTQPERRESAKFFTRILTIMLMQTKNNWKIIDVIALSDSKIRSNLNLQLLMELFDSTVNDVN